MIVNALPSYLVLFIPGVKMSPEALLFPDLATARIESGMGRKISSELVIRRLFPGLSTASEEPTIVVGSAPVIAIPSLASARVMQTRALLRLRRLTAHRGVASAVPSLAPLGHGGWFPRLPLCAGPALLVDRGRPADVEHAAARCASCARALLRHALRRRTTASMARFVVMPMPLVPMDVLMSARVPAAKRAASGETSCAPVALASRRLSRGPRALPLPSRLIRYPRPGVRRRRGWGAEELPVPRRG
jgi:hypothetical protein